MLHIKAQQVKWVATYKSSTGEINCYMWILLFVNFQQVKWTVTCDSSTGEMNCSLWKLNRWNELLPVKAQQVKWSVTCESSTGEMNCYLWKLNRWNELLPVKAQQVKWTVTCESSQSNTQRYEVIECNETPAACHHPRVPLENGFQGLWADLVTCVQTRRNKCLMSVQHIPNYCFMICNFFIPWHIKTWNKKENKEEVKGRIKIK